MKKNKIKQQINNQLSSSEPVILVSLSVYGEKPKDTNEFIALAKSTGAKVLSVITGNLSVPRAKYYIGSGKAESLAAEVRALNVKLVLFDHELSPAQERNLEKYCQCRVLGRTGLILDIFARRAHTFEGKLQVELAQLEHLSTRLVRGWTHLERQKGGIGLRGPGETQLETDRRLLGHRIKVLKTKLASVKQQRAQNRAARQRSQLPSIALVGYTNAGKSSLFNWLTNADVYIADQLFATLDPTLRTLKLPGLGKVVLADTVGFIQDLPHHLVAAFRATLEELLNVNLLLHVVDASADQPDHFIQEVNKVLKQIGAEDVEQLIVYNKIDLLEDQSPKVDKNEEGVPNRIWISVSNQSGLPLLQSAITEKLGGKSIEKQITLEANETKRRAWLYELDAVKSESVDETGRYQLLVALPEKIYLQLVDKT